VVKNLHLLKVRPNIESGSPPYSAKPSIQADSARPLTQADLARPLAWVDSTRPLT